MKIFPTSVIKQLDAYTIEHEPITSINLMERAASVITDALLALFPNAETPFVVFAGAGNNGGDGLAVARMLSIANRQVSVFLFNPQKRLSSDCSVNLLRLKDIPSVNVTEIGENFSLPSFSADTIIIDALFGSGLNRPLQGVWSSAVHSINSAGCKVVAIDVPSGLFGEDNSKNICENIVRANITLTLQFPKLSFLLADNAPYVGTFMVLDIGLSRQAIENEATNYYMLEKKRVAELIHPRDRFAHKGCFGRALLVAGSQGMAGASLLAARAAMRSGVGLLTVNIPNCNNYILQTAIPEAMTLLDDSATHISKTVDTSRYNAVAVGPGLGQHPDTANVLFDIISNHNKPMVIDADALNILAKKPEYFSKLPQGTILTPHPAEFERLAGKCYDAHERLQKARLFAQENKIYIILKGAFTAIATPDGDCFFNPTGNPGMATGGSGDVLTGILLALLAIGYSPLDACRIGVYVHGLAGDIACEKLSEISLMAGDIVEALPQAWKQLLN